MSSSEFIGWYCIAGVTLAMMANSEYIRRSEKEEKKIIDERLNGVTEYPVYDEIMNYRHSIGGFKTRKK
jgi:hypothetical protein